MTLNEIPDVRIDPAGGNKFIVCNIRSAEGVSKRIVRADVTKPFHADIVQAVTKHELDEAIYTDGMRMECLGGGTIRVDPAAHTIVIGGESTAYGVEPNRDETVELLKKAYPDYDVRKG